MTGEKKQGDNESERKSSLNVPFLHLHSSSGRVVALVLLQPQIVAEDCGSRCWQCVHGVLYNLQEENCSKNHRFVGEEAAA